MRVVEDADPYISHQYSGERVGGGVHDDPFSYYTNLPVKFQFEIHPICETAVNESSQIAFFKKAELSAVTDRKVGDDFDVVFAFGKSAAEINGVALPLHI